jgi:hypothetical protein
MKTITIILAVFIIQGFFKELYAESDFYMLIDPKGKIKVISKDVDNLPKSIENGCRACSGRNIQTGLGDFININYCKNDYQWSKLSNFDTRNSVSQTVHFSTINELPVKSGYALIIESDVTHNPIFNGVFQIFPMTDPAASFKLYPKGNYLLVVLEVNSNVSLTKKNIVSVKSFPSYQAHSDTAWGKLDNVETDPDKILTIIDYRLTKNKPNP